jgi:mRNA interferase MazF
VPQDAPDALEAGDIVWLEFGPPIGHEQAGRRPALVISPRSYNENSSLILVCPISRNTAPWSFKVEIKDSDTIRGAILVDQVRSIDQQARFARRAGRIEADTLHQVYGLLAALLGIPVST